MDLTLTMLLPGLSGIVLPEGSEARFPALETLLARAKVLPAPAKSLEHTLAHLFAMPHEGGDLPVGAFGHFANGGRPAEGIYLRADPVHLVADQDKLYVAASESLLLLPEEGEALAQSFNAHFAEQGLVLKVLAGREWFLQLPHGPLPRTTPLRDVVGRDIGPYLPQGDEVVNWPAFLNEVQMLFHDHPVNRERSAAGHLPVNSIWPWGAGELPRFPCQFWNMVRTDEGMGRGLAQICGCGLLAVPLDAYELYGPGETGRTLVVHEGLVRASEQHTPETRLQTLQKLEKDWFEPLLAALRVGRHLQRIDLIPGGEVMYSCSTKALTPWRFWRRRRPLQTFA